MKLIRTKFLPEPQPTPTPETLFVMFITGILEQVLEQTNSILNKPDTLPSTLVAQLEQRDPPSLVFIEASHLSSKLHDESTLHSTHSDIDDDILSESSMSREEQGREGSLRVLNLIHEIRSRLIETGETDWDPTPFRDFANFDEPKRVPRDHFDDTIFDISIFKRTGNLNHLSLTPAYLTKLTHFILSETGSFGEIATEHLSLLLSAVPDSGEIVWTVYPLLRNAFHRSNENACNALLIIVVKELEMNGMDSVILASWTDADWIALFSHRWIRIDSLKRILPHLVKLIAYSHNPRQSPSTSDISRIRLFSSSNDITSRSERLVRLFTKPAFKNQHRRKIICGIVLCHAAMNERLPSTIHDKLVHLHIADPSFSTIPLLFILGQSKHLISRFLSSFPADVVIEREISRTLLKFRDIGTVDEQQAQKTFQNSGNMFVERSTVAITSSFCPAVHHVSIGSNCGILHRTPPQLRLPPFAFESLFRVTQAEFSVLPQKWNATGIPMDFLTLSVLSVVSEMRFIDDSHLLRVQAVRRERSYRVVFLDLVSHISAKRNAALVLLTKVCVPTTCDEILELCRFGVVECVMRAIEASSIYLTKLTHFTLSETGSIGEMAADHLSKLLSAVPDPSEMVSTVRIDPLRSQVSRFLPSFPADIVIEREISKMFLMYTNECRIAYSGIRSQENGKDSRTDRHIGLLFSPHSISDVVESLVQHLPSLKLPPFAFEIDCVGFVKGLIDVVCAVRLRSEVTFLRRYPCRGVLLNLVSHIPALRNGALVLLSKVCVQANRDDVLELCRFGVVECVMRAVEASSSLEEYEMGVSILGSVFRTLTLSRSID
ncbi:hypothetical protein BLNAU_1587 [Blattamonas nauphoetae]|uniref:Uncharacterized protein n=1 Tax=Blattamonas nauphoetae TaxID=2049346 RepID=A0ABQ9YIW3_9EUKA|nr:hypothetical protein BLNAU_1587 [Blattamonas nauphoetae]